MGTHLQSLKSNLQIFSIGKTSMAETWKKNVVIDAQDHLAGRLCATVAKELLRGNNVTIVRCEGIFITGNYYRNKLIMLEKMNHRTATNPKDGPFHHRAPSMMIKRMIRGMLPNKTGRGQAAHKRLQCFDGCPPPFDTQKKFKVTASLGKLCHEVGWQYRDVVSRLEAKRIANAGEWYKNKQAKAANTAAIDAQLAEMGY